MSPLSNRALWIGLWGAPAAWSIQLMLDYAVAAYGCYPHRIPVPRPELPVHLITGFVSGAAVVICLACLWTAVRSWVAARRAGASPEDEERTGALPLARVRFMAVAGIMTSLLFGFGAILNGVSPALVPPCW